MITVDSNAAPWAHQLAKDVEQEIERRIWPYVSKDPVAIADLPDATKYAWRKFFVSDGAGGAPEAISNGTAWVYPSGTAV